MKLYLIGSLRNPVIPELTNRLTAAGFDVFSDWYAAGPEADDYWQRYEKSRGRTYRQALKSPAARNVFEFDRDHLDEADAVVMVCPAGKSGHLELGYAIGSGTPGFIIMDEPGKKDRWDVMYAFATGIAYNVEELVELILLNKALDTGEVPGEHERPM